MDQALTGPSHWANCIANFDNEIDEFVEDYFADLKRKVLLVGAAGFDRRSHRIAELLAKKLGDRLSAIFVREERPGPSDTLLAAADENERRLRAIVPDCTILRVDIFGDDGAPVGGSSIARELGRYGISDDVTDVILDLSALSIGVGFPAAMLLLEDCEANAQRAFHLTIVSNPELDDRISSVPVSQPSLVRGFAPPIDDGELEVAQVWVPQLAHGLEKPLSRIGVAVGKCYKICPLLPFPSRNPRRADDLLTEFRSSLVDDWLVDPRDVVYASERNPLDGYRTLSMLKTRFDRTMAGTYQPRMVLSPVGSKVMAAGALMAAIEHRMAVHYLEAESYDLNNDDDEVGELEDMLVHLVLSGPLYAGYPVREDR